MARRSPRTSGTERAFQIIDCLVEIGEAATAYQIAKLIGAPLSTIYDSIRSLEKREILIKRGQDGKYFLGPRLYFYGLAYARGIEATAVYHHEVEALSRRSGESVRVCIRDGDYMVVATMYDGSDPFRIQVSPGTRSPLNWTSAGLLLVGHLPPEERAKIFARATPSPTGRAVTDPEELERICAEAWEKGYRIQLAETDFAIVAISVPVIDPDGTCRAALSMLVPESRAKERGEELARMAMTAARDIEKQMGWRDAMGNPCYIGPSRAFPQ